MPTLVCFRSTAGTSWLVANTNGVTAHWCKVNRWWTVGQYGASTSFFCPEEGLYSLHGYSQNEVVARKFEQVN